MKNYNLIDINEIIGRYWPISILFMSFTILSNIDEFFDFAFYISLLLDKWRIIVHGLMEIPINTILSLFGLDYIDIPSPVPETFLFVSMFLFATTNNLYIGQLMGMPTAKLLCLNPILVFYRTKCRKKYQFIDRAFSVISALFMVLILVVHSLYL